MLIVLNMVIAPWSMDGMDEIVKVGIYINYAHI